MPDAPFFLTTAIDYANGEPHLGHAFEKIGADTIARYQRQAGRAVHFLIGRAEHGQKVAQTAEARGVTPQALVDQVAQSFQTMWARLGISYDQFIRTTAAAHQSGVRALIERIFARNPDDFYEKAYEGWYCVGCEAFKAEGEIVDGKCPLHPTRELQWTRETNWFFRLSRYQPFLETLLRERPEFCQPDSRRNEILGLLAQGLEDVSASRSRFSWGVPFPRPTSDGETQTTYVWFDALPNYLTATGFPDAGYDARWPAQLHVIGKDITRFHCVIWPAMLEAAGLPLPDRVWAHGFVNLGGERFSKSAGVKLELGEAIDRFGADAFRYFLLREVPFDGDGNFSWERFEERYTADLANALGNLASRTVAMVEKYCERVVPSTFEHDVRAADAADLATYHAAMDGSRGYLLHQGLEAIWQIVFRANAFVQERQPWTLAKDPAKRDALEAVLGTLVRQLVSVAVALAPFMPAKAEELWASLGAPDAGHASAAGTSFAALAAIDPTGWRVTKGAGLFPRPEPKPVAAG
ncbi:MAG: methionine--tRNA ligase [Gemmatirosa sp.]